MDWVIWDRVEELEAVNFAQRRRRGTIITTNNNSTTKTVQWDEQSEAENVATTTLVQPQTLLDALQNKYSPDAITIDTTTMMNLRILISGQRQTLGTLRNAVLDNCSINTLNNTNETSLSAALATITELCLSQNLLADINEILALARFAPQLQVLDLSHNRFTKDDELSNLSLTTISTAKLTFANLRCLALSDTCLPWVTVNTISSLCPLLEELQLPGGRYATLELNTKATPRLQLLNLSNNSLTKWTEVVEACLNLPLLRKLLLNSNNLGFVDVAQTITSLPTANKIQLQSLSIAHNPLTVWSDIEALPKLFPSLIDVRFKDAPVLANLTDDDRRKHLIARLPGVTTLNGSNITGDERITAERFYLRQYLNADPKPARFSELESIHGLPEPLAIIDLTPPQGVRLYVRDKTTRELLIPQPIYGLFEWSARDLCVHIASQINKRPNELRLFFVDREEVYVAEVLRPDRSMLSCNMHDDDIIEVDLIQVVARK